MRMPEHVLELRLRAVAHTLDADAPAFDPRRLHTPTRRRARRRLVAFAVLAALAATAAAPAAVSALADWFEVDSVPELGLVPTDAAPGFEGRQAPLSEARQSVAFRVRTIASLGAPDAAHVRDDIVGGMITVTYEVRGIRLTQWAPADVTARAAFVPTSGAAEEITVGGKRALWIEGTARGTFTVTGADLGVHKELFDVAAGVLLWQEGGVAFLLQGAGTKEAAIQLAAAVRPGNGA
jgi:hypothetical protein